MIIPVYFIVLNDTTRTMATNPSLSENIAPYDLVDDHISRGSNKQPSERIDRVMT